MLNKSCMRYRARPAGDITQPLFTALAMQYVNW
jgi:hypothetical protein